MTTAAAPATGENFFERALDWVEGEFKKAETIEQKIAAWANSAVNTFKGLQSNQTVQFLESGFVTAAEVIDPALTPLISGIELAFPKILNVINTGTAEITKPANTQLVDFLTYLENVKGIDGSVYAGILATLSTALQNYVATNQGLLATPAQLIASSQAVHALAA